MTNTMRLTMLTGPHKGQRYCFCGQDPCVIGRMRDCTVQLSGELFDDLMSRHHFQLTLNSGCAFLQDLGSTNGTFLNGRRIEPADCAAGGRGELQSRPAEVRHGDVVTVAANSIRVELIACPGRSGALGQATPLWSPGQIVKQNCPIDCPPGSGSELPSLCVHGEQTATV